MSDDQDDAIPEYSGKWWSAKITKREKEMDEKWRNDGCDVLKAYLDDRKDDNTNIYAGAQENSHGRKYNIFWANIQIIKSALYATPPRPEISREHADADDDVGRCAALILQRIIQQDFQKDNSQIHFAIQQAVEDRLLPGMGQVWCRYDVVTEPIEIPAVLNPDGSEREPARQGTKIVSEDAPVEYVHWKDFLYSPVRVWNEKWWVARRVWMRKNKFVKKFGEKKWQEIKERAAEAKKRTDQSYPKSFLDGQAEVFEIWCEDTNTVYWVNRHLDDNLLEKQDPLKLDTFFPCPKPLMATHTSDDFSPRSDYIMVRDQYEELNILNSRISILTRALRVVGVYDKTATEVGKMISGGEFNMIPVDNWAAFAEQGGVKGVVDWFPVEVIAQVLERLTNQRIALINQIYELTSISDIMRGASNPRDTLGAQKLKAQYSSVRLQLTQQDIAAFVKEIIHLKCEIIGRHWQPETIRNVSQIDKTETGQTNPELVDKAIALIKDYPQMSLRIKIGEEQMSLADYNAEREMRVELITAIGQFLSQAQGMAEAYPAALPYIIRMIQWVIASFRGSSDIETILDEAFKSTLANPPQPAGKEGGAAPDNNPGQIANAQAKVQAAQIQEQGRAEDRALKKQMNDDNNQTKVLIEQMKMGQDDKRLQQEAIGMQLDAQQSAEDRVAEDQRTVAQLQHTAQQAAEERKFQQSEAAIDRKIQQKESMLDRTLQRLGLRQKSQQKEKK